jgi:hypothetical protein
LFVDGVLAFTENWHNSLRSGLLRERVSPVPHPREFRRRATVR